ncbi:MAG: PorV/PorQ family protein [Candidatus Neomarinimicrobiota bacterium]
MRRNTYIILWLIILITQPLFPENKKLAQTGLKFLSVGSDARGGGLGDAVTTVEMGSSSLFFNPAGMARLTTRFDLAASQNNWFADIKHNSYSVAFRPALGQYGVFGLTFMSVDYGKVQGTMVWGNDQGFIDTEVLKPSAFAAGVGYARALSDKFSVGGQMKITGQNLGKSVVPVGDDSLGAIQNLAVATAFDFGTMFRTGFKSLVFGMSVRNFSNEIKYEKEGFQLPLTFRIGLSMNLLEIIGIDPKYMSCLGSIDAVHSRDYPEQIKVGLEYKLLNMFCLRAGFMAPSDEQHYAFGFGIQKFGAAIDYAYTPFGVFDNVQRFTLRFAL